MVQGKAPRLDPPSHNTANTLSQEAADGIFTFPDDRPSEIDALIQYLYTMGYKPPTINYNDATSDTVPESTFHLRMAILADRLDLPGLFTFSSNAFIERLNNKENFTFSEFAHVASEAYAIDAKPTSSFREAVVDKLVEQASLPTRSHSAPLFTNNSTINQLMLDSPQLAIDVATSQVEKLQHLRDLHGPGKMRFFCPGHACNFAFTGMLDDLPSEDETEWPICPRCDEATIHGAWVARAQELGL